MEICLFWNGPHLRPVDRVCVASMLKHAPAVTLYSYGPVQNLPPGVALRDAREIMPEAAMEPALRRDWTIKQFSDFFRVMLMKNRRGAWLDTDIFLTKPFTPDPAKHYLAWENGHRCGVAALYLPPESPVIAAFEDYLAGDRVVPKWLGFRRRVLRPALYAALGRKLVAKRAGLTIFGNDGITRLARTHGFIRDAAPKESFYYWNGKASDRAYDPAYGLEPLGHPDFVGFHFARKSPEQMLNPRPGSFYAWAADQVQDVLR